MGFLCTVVELQIFLLLTLHGPENSLKVFIVAMEMQQWVSFAMLSNYKIFPSAINNINVLSSSRKVPRFFVRF